MHAVWQGVFKNYYTSIIWTLVIWSFAILLYVNLIWKRCSKPTFLNWSKNLCVHWSFKVWMLIRLSIVTRNGNRQGKLQICFRKNCPSQNKIAPSTFFYAQIKFINIYLISLREKSINQVLHQHLPRDYRSQLTLTQDAQILQFWDNNLLTLL